ncbi:MAG TPA: lipopolysaccharide biosynthesis protein [Gaiellaceae bacterium]|nr:lipopolysaccharide biosynthesis protein [Gaiellaceae bacterium]
MRSGVVWRRSATAVGVYASAALGLASTVVAARLLGPRDFGLFALVLAATAFFQVLLDATVEEAAVKYGFRYTAEEDWGRLRRLFAVGARVKLAGGGLAALAIAGLAPLAGAVFGAEGLFGPLLLAALIPVVQAPESLAGAVLIVRERYDLRAAFMALAMALRLAGIAVGAQYGIVEAVAGILVAQVFATLAISLAAWAAFGRFPAAPPAPIGPDRGELIRFVLKSSAATALVTGRTSLAPLLLGVVSTPLQVGFFRAAQAPQTGLASLSAPARLVLLTEQTRDFESGRLDRVYRLLRHYVGATAVLMAVLVPLLWWLMPSIVELLYGEPFLPAVEATRLIVVAAGIALVFGWTKSFPVSIGRPGLRIATHGVETAVLLPLVLLLGGRWGATGAAAAVLLSTLVFAGLWTFLLVRIRRAHVGPGRPAPRAGGAEPLVR